jgi:hypothetical protein
MNWIENSINAYYKWLRDRTTYKFCEETQWCEINTPFMGMYNDLIDIYIKKNGNEFILSDDGDTIDKLQLLGIYFNTGSKRKQWCDYILRNYGIELVGDELMTKASKETLVMKKHHLISAIIELSDMETTAKNNVDTFFKDDVKKMLDETKTLYTPNFITKGSTGIDFTFDFQIAGMEKEMVIKTFNSLNKSNVPNFLFSWDDIKVEREKVSQKQLLGLAVVNDLDKEIKEEYLNALKIKGADYVLWSQRYNPENQQKK